MVSALDPVNSDAAPPPSVKVGLEPVALSVRLVVDRSDADCCRRQGTFVVIYVPGREGDRPRRGVRVVAGVIEGDLAQQRLIVGGRRRARQGEGGRRGLGNGDAANHVAVIADADLQHVVGLRVGNGDHQLIEIVAFGIDEDRGARQGHGAALGEAGCHPGATAGAVEIDQRRDVGRGGNVRDDEVVGGDEHGTQSRYVQPCDAGETGERNGFGSTRNDSPAGRVVAPYVRVKVEYVGDGGPIRLNIGDVDRDRVERLAASEGERESQFVRRGKNRRSSIIPADFGAKGKPVGFQGKAAIAIGRIDRGGAQVSAGGRAVECDRAGNRQQRGIILQRRRAERLVGLDRAGADLEVPVATEIGRAGRIVRGGDVGAGHFREGVDEREARVRLGEVAAVEQDVAAFRHCLANGGELARVLVEVFVAEDGVAELDPAVVAVADDLDGFDIRAALQRLGDLGQPVPVGVEVDDLGTRIDTGHQRLGIARGEHARIDENDLERGRLIDDQECACFAVLLAPLGRRDVALRRLGEGVGLRFRLFGVLGRLGVVGARVLGLGGRVHRGHGGGGVEHDPRLQRQHQRGDEPGNGGPRQVR